MPWFQEATFHDRQGIQSIIPQSTSSNTFVDLVGATLTTKDLSQPADYLGWASVLLQNTNNNALVEIQVLFNGVPVGNLATITVRTKDQDVGYTFLADLEGVPAGTTIQLQYSTDIGTVTIQEFAILIDGVPSSRVIS